MKYFDSNATTPLSAVAEQAWLEANREAWHNPSSPYRAGARVHVLLGECRERLAALLGCAPELIVFNSGSTEGNNSLFYYLSRLSGASQRVWLSAIEHPSVAEPARAFWGERVKKLSVDFLGVVEVERLGVELDGERDALVSVMAANNETGILQPWRAVLEVCQRHKVPYHLDASQLLGKESFTGIGEVDFVTGSAHKFGGPKGVGFLKIAPSYTGFTAVYGGAQENEHRGGTENYPAIAAMVAALEKRVAEQDEVRMKWLVPRAQMEVELTEQIPGIQVVGAGAERLANTISLLMPAHANTRWVTQLDKRGFVVSTGSACASGKVGASSTLKAMGYSREESDRVIRVSAGWDIEAEDWQALSAALVDTWKSLQEDSGKSQVVTL